MTAKEMLFARERDYLSPFACLSEQTKGRLTPLAPDAMRTEFLADGEKTWHLLRCAMLLAYGQL